MDWITLIHTGRKEKMDKQCTYLSIYLEKKIQIKDKTKAFFSLFNLILLTLNTFNVYCDVFFFFLNMHHIFWFAPTFYSSKRFSWKKRAFGIQYVTIRWEQTSQHKHGMIARQENLPRIPKSYVINNEWNNRNYNTLQYIVVIAKYHFSRWLCY